MAIRLFGSVLENVVSLRALPRNDSISLVNSLRVASRPGRCLRKLKLVAFV